MSKLKELNHLSDIYKNYDTFIIDLWGVIHNGVMLNPKAIEAVEQLAKNSKKIVFLSNAPRPSSKVVDFLLKMKMDRKYLSNVMTSGEAAMHAINKKRFGNTFYHLGPPRDTSVFEKVKENKTDLEKSDFISKMNTYIKEESNGIMARISRVLTKQDIDKMADKIYEKKK